MEDKVFSEYECRLARLALANKYLTRNQIQTCLVQRREAGQTTTLEDILIEQTYLTPGEVDELSRMVSQEASTDGSITRLFARIVSRRGLATEDQIEEALRLKRALASRKIRRPLGQILVERGYMTLGQVAEVLAEQNRAREVADRERHRFKAYVPQEMMDRGPRGTVCRARHPEHGEVALKVIPAGPAVAGLQDRLQPFFSAEIPGAVRLLETGRTSEGFFIASEYVDGVTLHDHVVGSMSLTQAEACRILRRVALALQAAHALGLAHGDLHSRNVILTEKRDVRITDFGLGAGSDPAADLQACRALWRFMLTGESDQGIVPALRFDDPRVLLGDLDALEAAPAVPAAK
jgi:hypothetical protein